MAVQIANNLFDGNSANDECYYTLGAIQNEECDGIPGPDTP